MNIVLVAIGGFFGSMFRFFLSVQINKRLIATWIANITGAIFLGILLRLYDSNELYPSLWALLGTGFCGAYTTFSTFGNETLQLLIDQEYGLALTYVCTTFIISLSIVALVVLI